MNSNSRHRSAGTGWISELLCHFSFWFGLVFATPVFIAANNREDIVLSLPALAAWAAVICVLMSVIGWRTAASGGPLVSSWSARIMLASALVFAIQGNIVHDLFNYGAFNGERVNFRAYGWKFWLEGIAWFTALPLAAWAFSRMKKIPAWLPALSILSFVLLLIPELSKISEEGPAAVTEEEIDPGVFAFSSISNLVHLLPDGFQGDVVRQVFDDHPDLAEQFRGFTLFTDHVGLHQGTAPSMQSMLTGEPFDLEAGFTYKAAISDITENTYQNRLADLGYQLDYVPISGFICTKSANSCIVRPFNDMKARGFYRHRGEDIFYSARLVADLTLFRLVPMYLKERIYNQGKWFFADTTLDGSSPWPDPVIREWSENLHVVDDRPVYKWYHYIGTHIPAKWDSGCQLLDESSKERAGYYGQAKCVLDGIAKLLERLDEAGVYDQTAMIISGDHGHNVAADDMTSPPLNSDIYPGLLATGRPTLLVKRKNDRTPLEYNQLPTSLIDIAPTALELAGVPDEKRTVFETPEIQDRERNYRVYVATAFFTGNSVPYVEYRVGQPANDGGQWSVSDIKKFAAVPSEYDPVNRPNAKGYVLGARLRKSLGNNKSSWITGKQLAFVIGLPDEPAERELVLSVQVPGWMEKQSFTVQFNQGELLRGPELKPAEGVWQTVRIPFSTDSQLKGENFVSVLFDHLYAPPNTDTWKTPGIIQSIRVVEAKSNNPGGDQAHQ